MSQRVLIPKRPRSVHYHRPGCGTVDEAAAAELARDDAEAIGYRAHACVDAGGDAPDPKGDGQQGVPA